MSDEEVTPEQAQAVRLLVQEIITTQVVLRDRAARDVLLDEYVKQHGVVLIDCITGFIYAHAAEVEGVDPSEMVAIVAGHDCGVLGGDRGR